MKKKFNISVIGGGIGGCMAAIMASKIPNADVQLFEKKDKLLAGLPFCHLHSGGFLYPMINHEECIELLNHSLEFANFFNECLDNRPTIIAYRIDSIYNTKELIDKCKLMEATYKEFCVKDNHVLGNPNSYYAIYTREDIIYYKKFGKLPEKFEDRYLYHDLYTTEFCKILNSTNIDDIKYPFVSVMEPSILMNKVYKKITKLFNDTNTDKDNIKIHTGTTANVDELINKFDYTINASGYQNNNKYQDSLLELKSSWMVINNHLNIRLPEIAIIGERGTKNGMMQISQCEENNIFQIHAMTNDSSIFECVDKIENFSNDNLDIIYNSRIPSEIINTRTKSAINEVSKLFNIFKYSKIDLKLEPLWGVQRIISKNKDNRVADVVFPAENYAEIQIIKGISSVTAANKLIKKIKSLQ
jgi:hypothetical protein